MDRITISLDEELSQAFDKYVASEGYKNRSEAIRDLIQEKLLEVQLDADKGRCAAVVSYGYNHEERNLAQRMVKHQHLHTELVVSSMHVHLDEHNCVETVVLRGATADVKELAKKMLSETHVVHGAVNYLVADSSGHVHGHHHEGDGHSHS